MTPTSCWPRETLKDYLNGAADESVVTAVESHLASCPECEQTIVELEANPDTLWADVREQQRTPSQAESEIDSPASVVQRAVTAVRDSLDSARASGAPLEKPGEIRVRQIGAYELLRPLGRGGMGLVMLARHTSLNRQVAIKILPSLIGDRPELVRRFEREIVTAGKLHHPAIVNTTDAGQEQGTHYLVMEYIDGLDLSRVVRLVGQLTIPDACEIIRQTALGLSYAHAQGIVHRDIKPSNLMLDAQGRLKILDFGLAQLSLWDEAACELTTVGQLMGTLDYMAPEQAERAGPVDHRADLYALGATLFRLLTGRAPLAASPNLTLLEKVRLLGSQSPPSIATLREDCNPELVELVLQMLSRDPAQRPASAAHVAEALLPLCQGHQLDKLLATARDRAESPAPASLAFKHDTSGTQTSPPIANTLAKPIQPPNKRWWLTAAGLLPLIVFAGILIVLETQKGQLVIESEVADVQVKITSDSQVTQELTVHTGTQSTRLRADKYEITIAGAADGLTIENDHVQVMRGETVIARIKQKDSPSVTPEVDRVPQSENLAARNPSSDDEPKRRQRIIDDSPLIAPTYKGEDLNEWLRILRAERDTETQLTALKAVVELGKGNSPTARRRIREAVAEVMLRDRLENVELFRNCQPCWQSSLPSLGHRSILGTMYANAIYDVSDPSEAFDVFTGILSKSADAQLAGLAALIDVETPSTNDVSLCKWLIEPSQFERLDENVWPALLYLEICMGRQPDLAKEILPDLIASVRKHPKLGMPAVLMLQARRYAGVLSTEAAMTSFEVRGWVEDTIAPLALAVLADEQSAPKAVAMAAGRLASTTEIVQTFRPQLIEHIRRRLQELTNDSKRLAAHLSIPPGSNIPAGSETISVCDYNILSPPSSVQVNFRASRRYFGSEIISLLALVSRLTAREDLDQELMALVAKLEPGAQQISKREETDALTQLGWPFESKTSAAIAIPDAPEALRAREIYRSLIGLVYIKNK